MKIRNTGFNLNEKGEAVRDMPGSIRLIYFFSSAFFASSFFSCLSSLRPFTAFTAATLPINPILFSSLLNVSLPAHQYRLVFFQKLSYRILLLLLFSIMRYLLQSNAFSGCTVERRKPLSGCRHMSGTSDGASDAPFLTGIIKSR